MTCTIHNTHYIVTSSHSANPIFNYIGHHHSMYNVYCICDRAELIAIWAKQIRLAYTSFCNYDKQKFVTLTNCC